MKAFKEFFNLTKKFAGHDGCVSLSVPEGFTDARMAAQAENAALKSALNEVLLMARTKYFNGADREFALENIEDLLEDLLEKLNDEAALELPDDLPSVREHVETMLEAARDALERRDRK